MTTADSAVWCRCLVSLFVTYLLMTQPLMAAPPQQAPAKLSIVIVEGEGAINNIRQRTAREPIVQVVGDGTDLIVWFRFETTEPATIKLTPVHYDLSEGSRRREPGIADRAGVAS